MKISISVSKKINVRRKRGVDKSGIDIRIIGIVCFLFIAGNGVLNYELFKIVLSAMVIIDTIDQIRDSKLIIGALMSRLGEEHQYMIG